MDIVLIVLLCFVIAGTIGGVIGLIIYGAMKDSEHPISCPNCGGFFRLNWKKLFPSYFVRLYNDTSRILRCPLCNKKDICKIHIDKI